MRSQGNTIRLSPSNIGLFLECPRCFYFDVKRQISRPRGPFPSLPSGMDYAIKRYFDKYRRHERGLPPELEGKVRGRLVPDAALLSRWRDWRTGLIYRDAKIDAELTGALDDCLIHDDGTYAPVDYKTRGFALKENSTSYYQHQLDAYTLMLEANGYPTRGISYLVYYYPREVAERGSVQFNVVLKDLETDVLRAREVFQNAVMLLRKDEPPAKHAECAFCAWGEHIHSIA